MSVCLDRFACGISDPQEREPEVIGNCEQCGEPICAGESYVWFDDMLFCDHTCFMEWMGAEVRR